MTDDEALPSTSRAVRLRNHSRVCRRFSARKVVRARPQDSRWRVIDQSKPAAWTERWISARSNDSSLSAAQLCDCDGAFSMSLKATPRRLIVLVSSRFGDDADELCGTCAECCARSEEEHRIGDYRSEAMRTLDCVVESGRLAARRAELVGYLMRTGSELAQTCTQRCLAAAGNAGSGCGSAPAQMLVICNAFRLLVARRLTCVRTGKTNPRWHARASWCARS